MAYVQADILLTAPYTTQSDEMFKRASSFQESLEAELKTYYKMEDACRHPDYLRISRGVAGPADVVLRGGTGNGRSERSDGTESPGTILDRKSVV